MKRSVSYEVFTAKGPAYGTGLLAPRRLRLSPLAALAGISPVPSTYTDDGEILDLMMDSPAAVVKAVHQAVIRWRTANLLQHHTATATLLQSPGFTPPDSGV